MNRKRLFDIVCVLAGAIVWLPVLAACGLAVLVSSGRPAFYVSTRRVGLTRSIRLFKLRTMIKSADKIANRDTVPVKGVRFLNISPDSSLYTSLGRVIERFHLTELPQLLHVLTGRMSLIGSRPLPENVIACLREAHPYVEDRFLTKAGITGPVQLVGRYKISDQARLGLEIQYCRIAASSYSARLDLMILLYTVLIALRLRPGFSSAEVEELLSRYASEEPRPVAAAPVPSIVVPEESVTPSLTTDRSTTMQASSAQVPTPLPQSKNLDHDL